MPQPPPVKREIRPAAYNIAVGDDPATGRKALIVVHPLEGDLFVYALTPENVDAIRGGLSGLHVAHPNEVLERNGN
jgi:hypothetical protein